MRFIRKDALRATARHVQNDIYDTTRLLLRADAAGVGVTDITLAPGIAETYGYDAHTEIAYCVAGEAVVTDPDGNLVTILPGTLWIAQPGERFGFVAAKPTRLICVFIPPLDGSETGLAAQMADPR